LLGRASAPVSATTMAPPSCCSPAFIRSK
jgi:hypothetical protein